MKPFCLLVVLCLALTACSQTPSASPASPGNTPAGTATDAPVATSRPADTAGAAPTAGEPMELRLLGQDSWAVPFKEWNDYPTWRAMAELFAKAGLKLNFEVVPRDQYPTTVQTRMAAGVNLPDIVEITPLDTTTCLNLAEKGIIVDVMPLLRQYGNGSIETFWEDYKFAKRASTAPDGCVYWFAGASRFEVETQPGTLAYSTLSPQIRLDWLEKCGLEQPKTVDEFKADLEMFRKNDMNGNGKPDEIMLFDPSTFCNGVAQWFGLGTSLSYTDLASRKVVSPWEQPGVEKYFAFVKSLVDAGLVDTSLIGCTTDQFNQVLFDNRASTVYNYTLTSPEQTMKDIPGVKYVSVDPCAAVDGITPAVLAEPSEVTVGNYAVTRDCKDPKAAILFFETVFSPEYKQLCAWGREGEEFEVRDGAKHLTAKFGTFDQKSSGTEKMALGRSFCFCIMPDVQNLNLESQADGREDYKMAWQMKYNNYTPMIYTQNVLALPDGRQTNRKAELINNLNTYSTESATKLATGEIPLTDLPNVVDQLKKLGLDELLQIDQALFDKWLSN